MIDISFEINGRKVRPGQIGNELEKAALEAIKKDIPWDLKVSENLIETAPPSEEEVAFIREFAPTETVGRGMMMELTITNFFKESAEK